MKTRKPNLTRTQARFACLDLCDFQWSGVPAAQPAGSEQAILLEIWHSGGLFQTSSCIPKDSTVIIATETGRIQGRVYSCESDPYGYIVEVRIANPQNWFPDRYQPPYLIRRKLLAA